MSIPTRSGFTEWLLEIDKVSGLEDRVGTLKRIVQMQRQKLNAWKGA